MNKILTFSLTAAICLCAGTAYAEIENPTFGDSMDAHFNISTFKNQEITFSIFKQKDNVILPDDCVYQTQLTTDESGAFTQDITLNAPSGHYTAVLSSRAHKAAEELPFYYINKKHLENTIESINKASSAEKLGKILNASWEEIEADTELINKVQNTDELYDRLFKNVSMTVTEENLADYRKFIREQTICELADEGVLEGIIKYAEDFGLDKLNVWNDFKASNQEKNALAGMKDTNPQNASDFAKKLEERAVVRVICGSEAAKIKSMLDKYGESAGLTELISEINALNDRQQYSVYAAVARSGAYLYSTLKTDISSALSEAKRQSGSTSSSIGGGGGGGSISSGSKNTVSVISPVSGIVSETTAQTAKVPFTDLEDCDWAKEAIETLYKKNIVSGRSESSFAPNDNITREEFLTMLMNALNLNDLSAECDFADASKDRWSYKTIASAAKYGILQGYNGYCNPSDNITRQDLTAMAYRALKVSDINLSQTRDYVYFSDNYEIANYAAEAVEIMYRSGVINGMTESEFVPNEAATRAQSAKIIYEIIKNR